MLGEHDNQMQGKLPEVTDCLLRTGNRLASCIINKDHRSLLKNRDFFNKESKTRKKEKLSLDGQ